MHQLIPHIYCLQKEQWLKTKATLLFTTKTEQLFSSTPGFLPNTAIRPE